MTDMGTKEASELWGVPQSLVQKWCRQQNKIVPQPTQDRKGSPWHIAPDAVPPTKVRGTESNDEE